MDRPKAGWALLGLLLLAAAKSSSALEPVPTAAHHKYTQIYKEFDEGAKLSDGHSCFDEPAHLNGTVISASKQQSVEACRKQCQCAPEPPPACLASCTVGQSCSIPGSVKRLCMESL